jgi:hypothetical protein
MIRYLLDTDHVSLHERGHPPLLTRLAALPSGSIAVNSVAVSVANRVCGRLCSAVAAALLVPSSDRRGSRPGVPWRVSTANPNPAATGSGSA